MIYKEKEFKKFLMAIEEGQQPFWKEIADAIGVDQDTITAWKELPEAKEAIRRGIQNTLREMEGAGRKDWRMWEARLKMLGINPAIKVDAKVSDTRKEILSKYGLISEGDDAGQTPEA